MTIESMVEWLKIIVNLMMVDTCKAAPRRGGEGHLEETKNEPALDQ